MIMPFFRIIFAHRLNRITTCAFEAGNLKPIDEVSVPQRRNSRYFRSAATIGENCQTDTSQRR